MKRNPVALIIDDEQAIRRLLRIVLEPQGYRVLAAPNGRLGLETAKAAKPDVIILDLELPDTNGIRMLQHLRELSSTPILILSERNDDAVKVSSLDNGANDFMSKPFSSPELSARLRVLQREMSDTPHTPPIIENDWTIDTVSHEVTFHEKKLNLTKIEETLFHALVSDEGKTVTYQHLLETVWGDSGGERLQSLRFHIANLRKKLKAEGAEIDFQADSKSYRLILNSKSVSSS